MNFQYRVLVCNGTGCNSVDSARILKKFELLLQSRNLNQKVELVATGCLGLCAQGPVVIVYPEGAFYSKVTEESVQKIVNQHLISGRIVRELIYKECLDEEGVIKPLEEINFYKNQKRIALMNCGRISATDIEDYKKNANGFKAMYKALFKLSEAMIIKEIKKSGLRGRGGAGFLTGEKWGIVSQQQDEIKYVVCNADEGDPGAYTDRAILEGDPFGIIEAMVIAGFAIKATKGYIYIRMEYILPTQRIRMAIQKAKEQGYLGKNILSSGFDFDIEIRLGAGAFVCGEETALISSIEGKRGVPNLKPPYPSQHGIYSHPTLINNVETLINIPKIILFGSEWFSSVGTKNSKGTKVFALSGDIKNTGIVEVALGSTIKQLVFETGMGIIKDKNLKAVQIGGPSGGFIDKDNLDIKIDYEELKELGTIMGSGSVVVLDDSNCMVNMAKYVLEFSMKESCGKCSPCREGLKRMYELLENITSGIGTMQDVDKLIDWGNVIKETSLCGLGKSAPNPVLSTLKYFRKEYEDHVIKKTCNCGVCEKLFKYWINEDCIGCGLCSRECKSQAIIGNIKDKHYINHERCIKCGDCILVCPIQAIERR